ncbi:alpha/beta fold hydrolase [Spirillospora sp. CA-255316]
MDDTSLSVRVEASSGDRPWIVLCNAVGVPHAIFDRLVDTLADAFSVVCWQTSLTEGDEPHGSPRFLTVDEQAAEATRILHRLGVTGFTGVSWCSGTEILYRLSRHPAFHVHGHCCLNGAFNLGADGPSSDWENTVEPLFHVLSTRPETVQGVSAMLKSAATAATEGGDPALEFPYSTPERLVGYAAQCLAMKQGRTLKGFVESEFTGLYLAGSDDAVQAPAISRRAADLSGSAFELVPGGGHAMMADVQEVCDRVRRYCELVSPRPRPGEPGPGEPRPGGPHPGERHPGGRP